MSPPCCYCAAPETIATGSEGDICEECFGFDRNGEHNDHFGPGSGA